MKILNIFKSKSAILSDHCTIIKSPTTSFCLFLFSSEILSDCMVEALLWISFFMLSKFAFSLFEFLKWRTNLYCHNSHVYFFGLFFIFKHTSFEMPVLATNSWSEISRSSSRLIVFLSLIAASHLGLITLL